MTIQTEPIGSGFGTLYEDTSGGDIVITISHPSYTSSHRFRVRPFGASVVGQFNSPPTGTTSNIQQEADNLASLVAAIYDASTNGAFTAANQALGDDTGVQPYPFDFSSSSAFGAGTGGGAASHPAFQADLTGKGVDGSKWGLHLPGPSTAQITDSPERQPQAAFGAAFLALANYLIGEAVGPVHAVLTNVVTHSGVQIAGPLFLVTNWNKRVRRRFRIA